MGLLPNPLVVPVGFLVGILIALPIGPINLLGLQRAVERGFLGGVAAGIGIMLGDGLIALAAALGVNALTGAIREYRTVIQIIGGVALMGAGAKLYFTTPRLSSVHEAERATLADFAWEIPQLFFLTITNPGAVLGLIAIFGGVSSFVEVSSYADAITMVASIMGGSLCYWIVVSRLIGGIRHRFDAVLMTRINRVAGTVLIGFGLLLIGQLIDKRWRTDW